MSGKKIFYKCRRCGTINENATGSCPKCKANLILMAEPVMLEVTDEETEHMFNEEHTVRDFNGTQTEEQDTGAGFESQRYTSAEHTPKPAEKTEKHNRSVKRDKDKKKPDVEAKEKTDPKVHPEPNKNNEEYSRSVSDTVKPLPRKRLPKAAIPAGAAVLCLVIFGLIFAGSGDDEGIDELKADTQTQAYTEIVTQDNTEITEAVTLDDTVEETSIRSVDTPETTQAATVTETTQAPAAPVAEPVKELTTATPITQPPDNNSDNGIQTWTEDGVTYTGQKVNGKLNGNGRVVYSNGDIGEGYFVNGFQQGEGTYKYKNGDTYEGGFVDGYFEGKGVFIWANDSVYKKYEGDFAAGKFEGHGIMTYYNGTYEGDFVANKREGYGVTQFTYDGGGSYQGRWKNDMYNGYGIITHNDKERFSFKGKTYATEAANWNLGKKDGPCTYFHNDGTETHVVYDNGVLVQ